MHVYAAVKAYNRLIRPALDCRTVKPIIIVLLGHALDCRTVKPIIIVLLGLHCMTVKPIIALAQHKCTVALHFRLFSFSLHFLYIFRAFTLLQSYPGAEV